MRIDDVKMDDDVTQGLRRLNSLAKVMKQRRVEQGSVLMLGGQESGVSLGPWGQG